MPTVTQVPGTGLGVPVEEQPGRVGQAGEAALVHLEAAHLVGRAVAVLQPAHHAQRGVLVALELQHHVDQVLKRARAGHLPVLGDVPDEHGGDAALLGHRDQRRRDRPHLRDAAGDPLAAAHGDRLHRVEHEQARLHRVEVA
jgi:hypothetical protein